jgi:mono/diheme cytochrome c family protein
LAFPYSVRESLAVWRAVNFHEGNFQPDPARSDKLNRGAYLVQGLGHCGACHTPRNLLQGSKQSEALGGAEISGQGWFAPNITSDVRQGIGGWSEQDLVDYLKTGVAAKKAIVAGPMAEVVHGSLSHLSDDDVHAIAAYLKSVPPQSLFARDQGDGSAAYRSNGAVAYLNNCGYCHQANGGGIAGAIPNLAGNAVVGAGGADGVIRTILNGMQANGPYAPMPALGRAISPGDIADIANYVRTAWGNSAPANATPGQVSELAKTTDTMLSGMGKCSPVPAPVAAALERVGGGAILQATDGGNALETLNALVPKVKQADPALAQADLINGLTAAYCPIVMGDKAQSEDARLQRLQRFSMLAFTAIAQRDLPDRSAGAAKTGQK